MKATLSLAVFALLNNVGAVNIKSLRPLYQKHPQYDVMIQTRDHENDTDDVVPVEEFTQHKADDHENDTDDIVHEFDDSLHSQIMEQAETDF